MKKTFAVQILGADNGSGAFERGGDLDFKTVEIDGGSTLSFERQLSNRIAHAVLTMNGGSTAGARVEDEQVTQIGAHFVVTLSIVEKEAGEQNFAFVATEVS